MSVAVETVHAFDAAARAGRTPFKVKDLTLAEAEREDVAAVPGGVELLAGAPRHSDVVHVDGLAGRGLGAVAHDEVLQHQVGRWGLTRGDVDVGLLVEIVVGHPPNLPGDGREVTR
mgnify:CR=1 FL=1